MEPSLRLVLKIIDITKPKYIIFFFNFFLGLYFFTTHKIQSFNFAIFFLGPLNKPIHFIFIAPELSATLKLEDSLNNITN